MKEGVATRSAFDVLEEALQLLRRLSVESWMPYLFGAIPLLLTVLEFFEDMTGRAAIRRCLIESLACALVFLWAWFWKTRFAGTLASELRGEDSAAERSGVMECASVQILLQSAKLVVLPLALVSVFPLAWTWAFFRSANLEANRPGCTLRSVAQRSAKHGAAFTRSTWAALLLLGSMGAVVFVNVLIAVVFLPKLTKIFTGYENEWTRNAWHVMDLRLVAIAGALTWFVVDPLITAYFAVRSFYSEARSDGRDILAKLRQLATVALIVIAIGASAMPALAGFPTSQQQSLSTEDLDRAVAKVIAAGEYDWQREQHVNGPPNSLFDRIGDDVKSALEHVDSWLTELGRLITKLFPQRPVSDNRKPPSRSGKALEWWMLSVGGILIAAVIVALFRSRRAQTSIVEAAPEVRRADVAADLLATDMPDDEWLRLAREYEANNEPRLAVRAMYLANLAYLGARHLIAVQKSKSNSIYERELRVRGRAARLASAFTSANRRYERVWYGLHPATPELVEAFKGDMEVIRQHGEP